MSVHKYAKRLWRHIDQDSGKLEVVTNTAEIEQVPSHKLLGFASTKT